MPLKITTPFQFCLAAESVGQDGAILPDDQPVKLQTKQGRINSDIINYLLTEFAFHTVETPVFTHGSCNLGLYYKTSVSAFYHRKKNAGQSIVNSTKRFRSLGHKKSLF